MKKIIALIAILALLVVTISSCRDPDMTYIKVEDAEDDNGGVLTETNEVSDTTSDIPVEVSGDEA